MIKERPLTLVNGWFMLVVNIVIFAAAIAVFIGAIYMAEHQEPRAGWIFVGAGLLFVTGIVSSIGLIILMPNEACLYTLIGAYVGTARDSGFGWATPFRTKRKISLRARSMEGAKLKVNDKGGNPIEIAAVVVWRVQGTR